jgi:hypothetical protein
MDVEKTIQFLLEQQAKFDAREAQSRELMAQIQSVLLDVATKQENTNAILTTLAERHSALALSHEELAKAQRETEHRLSSLAQSLQSLSATVERHIATHR